MNDRWLKTVTWIFWAVFIVFMCLATLHSHSSLHHPHHTVSVIYWYGAKHWLEGVDLYNGQGTGFIYFPQSAVLYSPLTFLPFAISEVVLRLIMLIVLAYATYLFSKLFSKPALCFLIATVVICVIGFPAIRGGQFNVIITECLLLSLWCIYADKYILASVVLCVALALKPLIIPLLVIVFILYPSLRLKLMIGVLIVIAFPFLTQHPSYVLRQYGQIPHMLVSVAKLGNNLMDNWIQLFTFLRRLNVMVSHTMQNIISFMAALLTLALCAIVYFKRNKVACALYFYSLVAVFLMLFNLRNEANSFVILGPAVGFFMADSLLKNKMVSAVVAFIVFLGIKLLPAGYEPMMAVLFFLILLPEIFSQSAKVQNE